VKLEFNGLYLAHLGRVVLHKGQKRTDYPTATNAKDMAMKRLDVGGLPQILKIQQWRLCRRAR
jgi:hypothetical protein